MLSPAIVASAVSSGCYSNDARMTRWPLSFTAPLLRQSGDTTRGATPVPPWQDRGLDDGPPVTRAALDGSSRATPRAGALPRGSRQRPPRSGRLPAARRPPLAPGPSRGPGRPRRLGRAGWMRRGTGLSSGSSRSPSSPSLVVPMPRRCRHGRSETTIEVTREQPFRHTGGSGWREAAGETVPAPRHAARIRRYGRARRPAPAGTRPRGVIASRHGEPDGDASTHARHGTREVAASGTAMLVVALRCTVVAAAPPRKAPTQTAITVSSMEPFTAGPPFERHVEPVDGHDTGGPTCAAP